MLLGPVERATAPHSSCGAERSSAQTPGGHAITPRLLETTVQASDYFLSRALGKVEQDAPPEASTTPAASSVPTAATHVRMPLGAANSHIDLPHRPSDCDRLVTSWISAWDNNSLSLNSL